jgi:hypothetical protein
MTGIDDGIVSGDIDRGMRDAGSDRSFHLAHVVPDGLARLHATYRVAARCCTNTRIAGSCSIR